MIRVNNKWDLAWRPGMTIDDLLADCKFSHRHIVVSVSGAVVPPAEYPSRLVDDGDEIRVVHVVGGG
ncbi:sulfur carrier protein ThiS [Chloroflexota bacterium]